jgi:IS1 family transposase
MARDGHTLLFMGGEPVTEKSVFSETKHLPLPSGPRIVYDARVKAKWIKEIESFNPDIVHAHNTIVGHFLLATELPVVVDDDEVYSQQPWMYQARPFARRVLAKIMWRQFPKWEQNMAERYPVITVSEGLADYYRQFTSRVRVVINTPTLNQVERLENPDDRDGLVYIGRDFSWPKFIPFRDMTGLREILDFDIIAGLPHREMMDHIVRYRIGLTPYRPHPFQLLCNANKNYEYLHAGLQVIVQRNFAHLFRGDPYVHPFTDYSEIVDVVNAVPDKDAGDIMKHARQNYIWENQEDLIKEAYRVALNV